MGNFVPVIIPALIGFSATVRFPASRITRVIAKEGSGPQELATAGNVGLADMQANSENGWDAAMVGADGKKWVLLWFAADAGGSPTIPPIPPFVVQRALGATGASETQLAYDAVMAEFAAGSPGLPVIVSHAHDGTKDAALGLGVVVGGTIPP